MREPSNPTRRSVLETSGLAVGLGTLAGTSTLGAAPASSASTSKKLKIAAISSVYYYLSHAYHIVGRFLDGFPVYDGHDPHVPDFDVSSVYIEQISDATDLGRDKAKRHNVRLSPNIADALTLGTGKLAVDAVLLIGEHGDYPYNDKLQKLYPRGKYFREIHEVFKAAGHGVPVFIDKHLSYSRPEALSMVEMANSLGYPLMAGSSLPITWRLPELEIPLGLKWDEAVVASRGDIEIFGFHALETLQCFVERRDRGGKPQGVKAVTCLEGDAIWAAGDRGEWSWSLLNEALGRSHSVNVGDIRQNTKDYKAPAGKDYFTRLPHPVAFLVEYTDGFKATSIILNGHVDDTTIAAKVGDKVASTLVYLPAPPGASFFNPLVLRIEDFFKSNKPPYPVERTLLTGGILDAALESRVKKNARIETPDLATIDYQAPKDSGYIRTPLTNPAPNPKEWNS